MRLVRLERVNVLWPDTGLIDPGDLRRDHEEKLQSSDGVLLFWGMATIDWFDENRRHLDARRFGSTGIYVTDPEDAQKNQLRNQAQVYFQYGAVDLAMLEPFLAPLRTRREATE